MKEKEIKRDSKISVAISVSGDYHSLNEGLICLQEQGIEVHSLEGIEGWLIHTAKISGVEEKITSEFLTQYLSDPTFISLYTRLFEYLQQDKTSTEGVRSKKECKEGSEEHSMNNDEVMKGYLEELYQKMN